MKIDRRIRRWALALLVMGLLIPGGAYAQEDVNDAVRSKCQTAGGQLLNPPYAVCIVSPYGTQSVVLRHAPSNSYDAVAMLTVGQEITAVGTKGEFYFVLLENGTTGWLENDEVRLLP